ncbi:MAG: sugar kinase [Chlorobiaceae bacterium]|nr:sugar kinase [Chlorobiaceae bacterium]MBA4310590.1 sugar kinase [Chlorobiaceae bacterium]
MSLLVVGSLGLDTVATPFNKVEDALGGSSTYISLSASYFSAPIHIIGVVGEDFPKNYLQMMESHNINLEGLQIVKGGKTFRWSGKYHYDLNSRDTLLTELNVFEKFNPVIPPALRQSKYICLGNIDPELQLKVLDQIENPYFVVCDTMNYWIERKRDALVKVLKRTDVLIINDSEARLFAHEPNLIKAAKFIRELGVKILIIKKGEHGALLFGEDMIFSSPAYPLEMIQDPTGAGDSFAGGFVGYIHKAQDISPDCLKRAVVYGSTMASFCVEQFSTKGLENLSYLRIQDRFRDFLTMSRFNDSE